MKKKDREFAVFISSIIALLMIITLCMLFPIDFCQVESVNFSRHCYEMRAENRLEIYTTGRVVNSNPASLYYYCGPVLHCETSDCNDGNIRQDDFVEGGTYLCTRESDSVYILLSTSVKTYLFITNGCLFYLAVYFVLTVHWYL